MGNPIAPISSVPALAPIAAPGQSSQPGAFQSALQGAIENIESANTNATDSVQKFLTGQNEELHSAILAVQQASIAFDLGVQVRNKVVDAYQEIMRMQM
ncbi:MAG TPA: flagellar hook-basal body complex protein FliE [Bryobacteraceae bacterium]|jgi:flagellar hook-basal body complex protein FliE|nr:flagellar hook-basal body complex protein FliE [Bryobacteraceae bacterium]